MPRSIELRLDDFEDEFVFHSLVSILAPIKEVGVIRLYKLMGILFEGHPGLTELSSLNWDAISPEDKEFAAPLIESLSPLACTLQDMPVVRRRELLNRVKISI